MSKNKSKSDSVSVLKKKISLLEIKVRKHKTAEKNLKETTSKLEAFIHSAKEGFIVVDNDDRIEFVNEYLCQLTGYKQKELINNIGYEMIVHPEDHKLIIRKNKTRQHGKSDSYELRMLKKSGEIIYTKVTGAPIRNRTGKVMGSIGIVTDVTWRKKVEENLKRKNEELKLLFESGKLLTSSLELADVYDAMFYNISKVTDCQELFVADYDDSKKQIHYTFLRSKFGDQRIDVSKIPTIPLAPKGYGILSETIRIKQSQILNDYQKKFKKVLTRHVVKDTGEIDENGESTYIPRSALIVPVIYEEKILGVVQIFSQRKNAYSRNDLELVEALMQQVALASYNAKLYDKVVTELTDRIKAEQMMNQSLKEKEVLLKEIYHRVKNNLQVVSSLIKMQIDFTQNNSLKDFLRTCQSRIRTMALVHEKLYRSQNLEKIYFQDYINSLVSHLLSIYQFRSGTVSVLVNAPEIHLGVDYAIPCALIINELVSNALKHAFPDGRRGKLEIEMNKAGNKVTLAVRNNGLPLPGDFDIKAVKGVGMQIVTTLCEQLETIPEIKSAPQTEFIISFLLKK